MARMTLTFGQVPGFADFENAFRSVEEGMTYIGGKLAFPIELNPADASRFMTAGLLYPSDGERRYSLSCKRQNGKTQVIYTAEQLYRLIQNLVELSEIDGDAEFAEWAGSFAGDILFTLDIESL